MGNLKLSRSKPNTWSLKEDARLLIAVGTAYTQTNNTLKASKVGHCASWSSWFELCLCCGIRLTLQESMTASCFLAKAVKETKHWFC